MTIPPDDAAEIDREIEIADANLADLLKSLPDDVDASGVLYCSFISLVHLLVDAGWDSATLADDVREIAADDGISALH